MHADNAQDLSNFTKPTTETITVTQAEVTSRDQNTLNKFLNEDGKLKVGDVTFTFNANERKATITATPLSTKAQGSVEFTAVTVEKPALNTLTKTTTQAITVTQEETTTPTQDTLNKFLQTAGSLTVNTDATIEFDTTNNKATITATPNSTKAQGSVEFTAVTVEKPALNTLTKTTTQAITVTQEETTTPTQDTLNKFLQTAGSLTVGTDVTITFDVANNKATLAVVANSTKAQGSVEFTAVTVEKPALNTLTKTTTQAITVTQEETTTPTQDTLNKFLQTAGSLTVGTDVTITFDVANNKATLAVVANSTKAQGSVEFTAVTVEKPALNTLTKTTTQAITVTQEETTTPTQDTLNKFLQTAGSLTVGTDVTITFDVANNKATLAVVANSTKAQGSVEFTAVTVEKPALNTLTKTTTQAITVTQEETTTPTQDTLNKFLQTAGSLTVGTDVTITFDVANNKATFAVVANSTKAQGSVEFTAVTVEKPALNTLTKTTTQAITVTQEETTTPTQDTLNKFLQTAGSLTVGTDVTITFDVANNKATLAVVANSTKAQGSVEFTAVTVEKPALNTLTKTTTQAITVTQEETTTPTQDTLNKFLQTAGSLTVGTDVTITFDVANNKATLAVVANSTKAQGSVEFTAVTVEKPALNTLTKTTTQAITVTQEETTTPTQDTLNKFLQTAGSLTVGTDVTITFDVANNKATLAVVANSTKAQGSVEFTAVTVEKPALNTLTKTTTQAITVTQEETTTPTQDTLNKFLQTAGSLTVGTDVTITFDVANNKATLAVVANSTKAQGSVEFTAVTVEKPALNTLTKTTTQAITVTQEETTTPTQDTLNKFLQTAGSLTVNTDATIEFDTTNNKATITATPNSTKAQGSVEFTAVTVEKPALNTLTKTTTQAITVTQEETTTPTQDTLNKFLQTAGSLTVGTDVTITFDVANNKATLAVVANSTKAQGSVEFTAVTVEKPALNTLTKTTTQAITVTQEETTTPTQDTLNKFLQTAGSLTVGTDVTITFDVANNKATLAVVANSTKAQGSVEFTAVTVEKPALNTLTKTTTQAITVTQEETTTPTQDTLNKFLQTAGSLTVGTDVTITFDVANNKATLAVVANSTKAQGSVEFTAVTVEKPALNTLTKTTTQAITVTQEETTTPTQDTLNKFLQTAGSLTVGTDVTITFDVANNKATFAVVANSTKAQGSVEFTAVTVEKPALNTLTKTTTQAITVTQEETTTPTQDTLNKFLQTAGSLTVGTDVTITFDVANNKATLAVVANSTKAQGSVEFTAVTVEKPALNTLTKTTTQAITVTQEETTTPTQDTLNKFLQTAGSLTVGTDVTITFDVANNKATLAVVANSTKAQGSVEFTAVTVEKPALNTLTKTTTQAITVTQEETTTPTQDTLNKFLQTAGSLTVNTDATIEFDTTNNKATITATPNSTKAQGSVEFTAVTVEKQAATAGTNTTVQQTTPVADPNAAGQSNAGTNTTNPATAGTNTTVQPTTPVENKVTPETKTTVGNTETKNPAVTEETSKPEESSNNSKTILICLTIFLTITLTVLIGLFIHNSKKQK
ncbi:beta strand repeat-containing protein [Candidatus Phytoplasma solani]|uniref:beta strand repeat-containing protein n=1 Tax=Candidatus Phytoplasma solani TaxID=69896 RepID=UPI00358F9597